MTAEQLRHYLEQIIGEKYRFPHDEYAFARMMEVEKYMIGHFEKYGWEVNKQAVQYDRFTSIWEHSFDRLEGYNVIATKPGKTEKTLIIAAHHDTVVGTPGADDNGTGVALLLHLAKVLAETDLALTIKLVSFDFEELGLAGSTYFVDHLDEVMDRDLLVGVFVLEMLGYYTETEQNLPEGFDKLYFTRIRKLKSNGQLNGDFYTVVYNGRSKKITKELQKASNMKLAVIRDPGDIPILGWLIKKIVPSVTTMLRSDHTPFWIDDLPAVMVTDTADFRNPNYHKKSDQIDTIDFDKMALVAKSLKEMIVDWNV